MTAHPKRDAGASAGDDANRRADLVRAAGRLFSEKGFDATTVRDIAAAVGMQSGSPFYHFGTKHDMLHAVMEQGLRDALERVESAVDGSLPAPERLRALVREHYRLLHDAGREFVTVLLYDWRSLPEEHRRTLHPLKDRYDALWQRTFEELREMGALDVDPKLARLIALGAINFSATWYRPGARSADAFRLEQLAEQTARVFVGEARSEPDADRAALRAARRELYTLRRELAVLRGLLADEAEKPPPEAGLQPEAEA